MCIAAIAATNRAQATLLTLHAFAIRRRYILDVNLLVDESPVACFARAAYAGVVGGGGGAAAAEINAGTGGDAEVVETDLEGNGIAA